MVVGVLSNNIGAVKNGFRCRLDLRIEVNWYGQHGHRDNANAGGFSQSGEKLSQRPHGLLDTFYDVHSRKNRAFKPKF